MKQRELFVSPNQRIMHPYLSANDLGQLVRVHRLDVVRVQLELEELVGVVVLLLERELHRGEDLLVVVPQAEDRAQRDLLRGLGPLRQRGHGHAARR